MVNISDTDRLGIDKQQKPFSGANNDLLRAGIERFASTGLTLQIHWSYTAANCVAKSCSAAVLQVRETICRDLCHCQGPNCSSTLQLRNIYKHSLKIIVNFLKYICMLLTFYLLHIQVEISRAGCFKLFRIFAILHFLPGRLLFGR